MTIYGEPRVWLEQFPLGEAVPFRCQHLGIDYPGEVVRVDTWSPRWGNTMSEDIFFRVVLLRQRRGGLEPVIEDPRIVVCLPAPGLYRRRSQLASEVSTTRETQAIYLTQQDTEAALIRRMLRRRLDELEEQLLGEDSVRYSEGRIVAEWLLSNAWPQLPLDLNEQSKPVEPEAAGEVFGVIFGQPDSSPDGMQQLVTALGLGRGANREYPNPVLELVRNRISAQDGPSTWTDLHRYLAQEIGLTGPLATMFLLVFLHEHRPGLSLELQPGHQVALFDGRPLEAGRITPDLIPALRWDMRISGWAGQIVPIAEALIETRWNDALHHLRAISPRLATASFNDAVRAQDRLLLEDISALTQDVAQVQGLGDALGWTSSQDGEDLELQRALDRMLRVQGSDYSEMYRSILDTYDDFRSWESDLVTLRELAGLARFRQDISGALEYLSGAVVPPETHPELSIDRQGLLSSLSVGGLAEFRRRNWDVLMREVAGFKRRFRDEYRSHHENIRNQLPVYQRDLESARLKLKALELLNTLPELGEPTGIEQLDSIDEMSPGLGPCLVAGPEILLDSSPWCESCRLSLDVPLSLEQLTRTMAAVDMALGAKNRQLAPCWSSASYSAERSLA